jgi:hypothetical protein
MSLAEFLERIGPLLDASGAGHWAPVLIEWISNGEGWYAAHSASETDPAYSELATIVEAPSADNIALASALAATEFARRAAILPPAPSGGPAVRWSIFDGPFLDFMAMADSHGLSSNVRTSYDVHRPASRLRDELLGRMLVARARVD